MTFFCKLYKNIYYSRREMSSFKVSLWEKYMFVNFVVPPRETEKKLFITMLLPLKKPTKINLVRNPTDTIKSLTNRLQIKISQVYSKKKVENPTVSDILVQVNDITVQDNAMCCDIFEKNMSNITIKIMDDVFSVLVDAPIINEFKLGNPPYKGFILYPYGFDKSYNVSVLNSKYIWYRTDFKKNIEVGNQVYYTPTADDVNCVLKLVCSPCTEDGQSGPPGEMFSSKVEDNIIETYPFQNRLKEKLNNSIRVVSYNILAEEYTKTKEAKNDMYPYCSAEVLASSYRNPLLIKELETYQPDIFCLQEVDLNFFNEHLNPLFKKRLAMNGLFYRKDGKRHEGLSCFYSSEKFMFLNHFNMRLNDLDTMEMFCGSIIKDILDNELWKQGLEKNTVFQVVVLKFIPDPKKIFLVCNTHLISDPNGDPIRLLQALIEFSIINQIKKNISTDYPDCQASVIFCGDFNSTPESGVFDLITKLMLPEEYSELELLNKLKDILGFKMHSAYDTDVEYSNYTQTFSGLLDYIYFTDDFIELIQVLSMPSHEDVIKHSGLPSVLFPSDHLALVADFKIKYN